MFICNKCGEERESLRTMRDSHGFDDGYYEEWDEADCECGGEFVEAERCPICGRNFLPDEDKTICDDCLEIGESDLDEVFDFTKEDTEKSEIRGLACFIFNDEEINDILEDFIRTNYFALKPKIEKFCKEYRYDFCEFLEKKAKEKQLAKVAKKEAVDLEKFMEEDCGE